MPCEVLRIISFDCAYRTLGWCILEITRATANAVIVASGVTDVLGEKITNTTCAQRANCLGAFLAAVASEEYVANAIVLVEEQPHSQSMHVDNKVIEAQIMFYYTCVRRALAVYTMKPRKKSLLAEIVLGEPRARVYAERKKQTRRLFARICTSGGCTGGATQQDVYTHTRADLADALAQALAFVFGL